jgi:hypothetical protein
MSRHALRTLIRAVGPGRVGLHSGEITFMPSLLDSMSSHLNVGNVISESFKNSYSTLVSHFSLDRRSLHTTTSTSAAAEGGGSGVQTAAEQFDLLPPDTGIVRIEG